MPLTPFHLGPTSVLGLFLFNYIDLPAFLIAGIIPDFAEPFLFLFVDHHDPLVVGLSHRFFHSFLGATILAVLIAISIYPLRGWLNKILKQFKFNQEFSFVKILYTALAGAYFHILLDSIILGPTLEVYSIILILGLILAYFRFKGIALARARATHAISF